MAFFLTTIKHGFQSMFGRHAELDHRTGSDVWNRAQAQHTEPGRDTQPQASHEHEKLPLPEEQQQETAQKLTQRASVDSLPLYVCHDGSDDVAIADDSKMVAVQTSEGRKPAIVMNEALAGAIANSLNTGLRAIYRKRFATAEDNILAKFEERALEEEQALTTGLDPSDEESKAQERATIKQQRLRELDEKLHQTNSLRADIKAQVDEAYRIALVHSFKVSALLQDLFDEVGFTDPEDVEEVGPAKSFVEEWRVPESDVFDHSIKDHASGHDSKAPRQQSSLRRSLHPSSSRRDKSRSPHARSPSPPPHQAPWLVERSPVEWKLIDCGRDLKMAKHEFERQRAHAMRSPDGTTSEADRQGLFALMLSTRSLVQAEARFREARHKCKEAGVHVLYSEQTSSFANSTDCEERFREAILPFCGPDNFPKVEKWLDDVEALRDSTTPNSRRQRAPSTQPETDEWETGPALSPWDSQSDVAEGREKVRIQRNQAVQEGLRKDAIEHQAQVMARRKRKRDTDEGDEEGSSSVKKQKC